MRSEAMTRHPRDDGYTLVEMTVAALILAVILAMVGNYLISADRTVANSAAHRDDLAAAQTVLGLMEVNIRFACDMSISGGTLYVENSCGTPQPACTEWSASGGQLIDKTTSGGSEAVANGISGLAFSSNGSYNGLVTIQFNLKQPQDQARDPGGISVTQTLTARNMPGPVATGSVLCP